MTECSSKHNRGVEQVFVSFFVYCKSISKKSCRNSTKLHAAPFRLERREQEVIPVPTNA